MIRAMVMADNSFLVDTAASILAQEIELDMLQLTYRTPRISFVAVRDHRSMVIMIDDGETDPALPLPQSCRDDVPLLLMKVSLKAIDLYTCRVHQLIDSRTDQLSEQVRNFSRTYLRTKNEKAVTWAI